MVRQERWVIGAGLAVIVLLAWAYLVSLSLSMSMRDAGIEQGMQMTMPVLMPWSINDFTLTFLMWVVMMIGMMIPSAAPMIMVYHRLAGQRDPGRTPLWSTGAFVSGYLATWILFSLAAALLQWGLHDGGLLNMQVAAKSPIIGGVILAAAGAYQFTTLKTACLNHCRTPMGFLLTEWRGGALGAFKMGVKHGAYCAGCCWMLMVLLFVGGVMNLLWVACIATYVLIEKVAPAGKWFSRAVGAGMLVWGMVMLASSTPSLLMR